MIYILNIIDEFVLKSDIESTILQINRIVVKELATKAYSRDKSATQTHEDYIYQLWHCLDNEPDQAEIHERVCYYPLVHSPLKVPASPELGQSRGY